MKLSELKALVDFYWDSPSRHGDDPEIVVDTNNGGVPTSKKAEIQGMYKGFDWEQGLVIVRTKEPLVMFRQTTDSLDRVGRTQLDIIKGIYDHMGSKYIAKARESSWIDGFKEGFKQFTLAVDKAYETDKVVSEVKPEQKDNNVEAKQEEYQYPSSVFPQR